MAYPSELQVLIIEDEASSKTYYDAVFDSLVGKGYDLAQPKYAFCYEDGVRGLSANTIYHLVVLDLRLWYRRAQNQPIRPLSRPATTTGVARGTVRGQHEAIEPRR